MVYREMRLTIPVDVFPLPYPGTNSAVENEAKLTVLAGSARFTACCASRESIMKNGRELGDTTVYTVQLLPWWRRVITLPVLVACMGSSDRHHRASSFAIVVSRSLVHPCTSWYILVP
jgi:hypothetical protein